jgi:eukaryotic-like serine/threonine-protein kinase
MDPIDLGESSIDLIEVAPGSFTMGSPNTFFSEDPAHEVTISHRYGFGKYPITQGQWRIVMGTNPSRFASTDDHPVETISWSDAVDFCRELSNTIGREVRLPTEAEWEYACRAGTLGDFFFSPNGPFTDETGVPSELRRALGNFAWFDSNSVGGPHQVGLKRPNPWGFHDLVGNLWEWCEDNWHNDYVGAPTNGAAWIDDANSRRLRCVRGGAWDMNAFRCRSCYRSWEHEEIATDRIGLRIVIPA